MKAHAAGGTKPTEGMIEEAVRRDSRWVGAIDTQTTERAEFAILDKQMDDFRDRVQWAQACIRYATSGAEMIAFATVAGAATLTEPQELRTCKTCEREKILHDFGFAAGKRIFECRVCARERWTRNRRARLEERMCLSCKGRKPFTAFPLAMRGVRRQLGMTCVDCMVAKELEAAKQSAVPLGRRVRPLLSDPDDDHTRPWASTPDFSQFAQQMLFPDRARPRDYKTFTRREREMIYAVTRELARRYSPMWDEKFDHDPPPLDLVLRPAAREFLLTATAPPALAEYIASRLCEEAAVYCAVTGTEPAVLMLDDPDLDS
jgi:hypothetical protein